MHTKERERGKSAVQLPATISKDPETEAALRETTSNAMNTLDDKLASYGFQTINGARAYICKKTGWSLGYVNRLMMPQLWEVLDGWKEKESQIEDKQANQGEQTDVRLAARVLMDSHAATTARKKLSEPSKPGNESMSVKEACEALKLKKSTVYEHKGLVRTSTGTRAVRFTTDSVLRVKNSSPD